MRRTAPLALTAAVLCTLAGCSGHQSSQNSLIVANLTGEPITVTFAEDPANTRVNPTRLEQLVLPHNSIRLSGQAGDRVTVAAGDQPPMVLQYAARSQVLHVRGDGAGVTYELVRGHKDPTANPPR